jgi:ABC-type transporter Mla maintaining outer membrane lipid asymmetry ATPase subunit MlaF
MEAQQPAASVYRERLAFIEVAQLTKRFAEVVAVDGISFDVSGGELFGFLGGHPINCFNNASM